MGISNSYTLYNNPILSPPPIIAGRNVVLLGVSTDGAQLDICYVPNPTKMALHYGSGPLVDAYEQVYNSGAYAIYVIRLNGDEEEVLDNDTMYIRLAEAYSIIEDFPVHIVVPVGVYLDDNQEFAQQLLNLCTIKKDYHPSIGIIGVKPADPNNLDTYINTLMDNPFMKSDKDYNSMDTGAFLSVVAHDIIIGETTVSGAYAYAGLVSSLQPRLSSTNKALKGADNLAFRYEDTHDVSEQVVFSQPRIYLSRIPISKVLVQSIDGSTTFASGTDYRIIWKTGELERLNGSINDGDTILVTYDTNDAYSLALRGYVTFRDSASKGIVPYRGVTAAYPESSYCSLSITRIVLEILELMQNVKLETLGEPVTQAVLNHLSEIISSLLDSKIDDGSLVDYGLDIQLATDGETVYIYTRLVPVGSHDEIKSVVSLNV